MLNAGLGGDFTQLNVELVERLDVLGDEAHRHYDQGFDPVATEPSHALLGGGRQPADRTHAALIRDVDKEPLREALLEPFNRLPHVVGVRVTLFDQPERKPMRRAQQVGVATQRLGQRGEGL